MALDVGEALRDGFDRGTERNALLLMVVVGVVSLASTALLQTATPEAVEFLNQVAREEGTTPPFPEEPSTPLMLPISPHLAALLLAIVAVISQSLILVAIRTFVSDERAAVPRELATRRIGWVTLNAVVGGLIVWALILLGLVFLVVPGIFVAVSLFFFEQEVAVEDSNLVEAIQDSWALSKGDRVEILLVGAVLLIVGFGSSVPSSLLDPVLPPVAGALLTVAISAVVTVVSVAIASRAYVQVKTAAEEDADDEPDEDEPVGALGPEDIDDAF